MNPLDTYEHLHLELMNPNPSSSKTKQGPVYRVSFELHQEDWQKFMDADTSGMMLDAVMVRQNPGEMPDAKPPKPEKGPYGAFAKWVYQSGILLTPAMWDHLGNEDDHRGYIITKPCVVCGSKDFIEDIGESFCEEAHVRRSDNSGTAFKPRYISVPMCHEDHSLQHMKGYMALYERWCEFHDCGEIRPDMIAEWILDKLKKKAMEYIEEWMKEKMYARFNVLTLTWVQPDQFQQFLDEVEGHSYRVPERFLSPQEVDGD